MLNDEHKK
jgi:hypothetical protein